MESSTAHLPIRYMLDVVELNAAEGLQRAVEVLQLRRAVDEPVQVEWLARRRQAWRAQLDSTLLLQRGRCGRDS